jgi:redox-sensitive bicupin YhaK (pirin superfamily)
MEDCAADRRPSQLTPVPQIEIMNTLNVPIRLRESTGSRAIVHRTRGQTYGPVTRMMSPPDLGEALKPFVFLDRIDVTKPPAQEIEGLGRLPRSGIATLTWLFEGAANYEDRMGLGGKLDHGWIGWIHAGDGAWHGGTFGDSDRLRGFQLSVALPTASEPSTPYSSYIGPEDLFTQGPVTVLLGRYGSARSLIEAPAPINFFSVRLEVGESWIYQPNPGHTVAWAAVSRGRLLAPQAIEAGELVAFEEAVKPIHFVADEDTDFVFGSAAKPYQDLSLARRWQATNGHLHREPVPES